MEERLLAALEALAELRRGLGLRRDRQAGSLWLLVRPGLAPALARADGLLAGLVSTDLRAFLQTRLPDPDLQSRLLDDLYVRFPPVLDRLRDLSRSTPEAVSVLGKREAAEVPLEAAAVEEAVRLVSDARELGVKAQAWRRELPARLSGSLRIKILGIGEITTTIEVQGRHWYKVHPTEKRRMRLAYKRMPSFPDQAAAERYCSVHMRYQELLAGLGIGLPWHDNLSRRRADGRWVVYNRQERFPNRQVACLVIREVAAEDALRMFDAIMALLRPVLLHNARGGDPSLAVDAQIPNWIVTGYRPGQPLPSDLQLIYIDTSTPLYRVGGVEQLDMNLFLKSVPALFRPALKYTVLPGVVDRYYRPREVVTDLVASYTVHGRPDLIPALVERGNRFLADAGLLQKPLSVEEITKYNRQDVAIWKVFRALKRLDRFVSERFLGRRYEQRLPPGSPESWENLVGAGGMGLVPEDDPTRE